MKSLLRSIPRWLFVVLALYLAVLGWLLVPRLVPDPPLVLPENLELSNRPTLGRVDAPVSIVIFSDFQCPHCKDFDREVLPKLEREFVDMGKVKITYLHNPFMSEDSYRAAMATECVYRQSQKAYWPYKRAVFELQQPFLGWATSEKLLTALKAEAAIDTKFTDLESCILTRKSEATVMTDKALAIRLGVHQVPTVFVNGKQQNVNFPELQKAVARELSTK